MFMNKKWPIFCFVLFSLCVGIYFHTNTLSVTHHQVELGKGNNQIRVAHISDLHTSGLGKLEKQVIKILQEKKPDIIFITGDIATPSGSFDGFESVLKKFEAPRGVYFVKGNWEYWEPLPYGNKLLLNSRITDLTNQFLQLHENLWLVGFDDSEEGNPELDILETIPKDAKKIGLFHSPLFFEKIAGRIDLNFAGHSHGGQIHIPFLGALWVPQGTGKYIQGWFEKEGSKLFVSRGIGTSILPIRFFCAPEVAIVDITY